MRQGYIENACRIRSICDNIDCPNRPSHCMVRVNDQYKCYDQLRYEIMPCMYFDTKLNIHLDSTLEFAADQLKLISAQLKFKREHIK